MAESNNHLDVNENPPLPDLISRDVKKNCVFLDMGSTNGTPDFLENREVAAPELLENNFVNGQTIAIHSISPNLNCVENSSSNGVNLNETIEVNRDLDLATLSPSANIASEASFGSCALRETSFLSNDYVDCCDTEEKFTADNNQSLPMESRPLSVDQNDSKPFLQESINLMEMSGVIENNFSDIPGTDENFEGEEFQDAVQFFKDPSSIQFLENMKSSNQQQAYIPRDSLYVKFDPLHNHTVPQSVDKEQERLLNVEHVLKETLNEEDCTNVESIVNKHIANVSGRQSFGNILLSFDSPVKSEAVQNAPEEMPPPCEPPRLYTEEEFQQRLKNRELKFQEDFLKNQKKNEGDMLKKCEEKDKDIAQLSQLCRSLQETLRQLAEVTSDLKLDSVAMTVKIKEQEAEIERLNGSLKTSTEDFQSVESTFSDFHKRYMKCRDMLATYKENEQCLKGQITISNTKLTERDQVIKELQDKMSEMVEKANSEIANAKKGSDAQTCVMKAQLKKSELKVSSLESDLRQMKVENDKLSSICDELMAKVSGGS